MRPLSRNILILAALLVILVAGTVPAPPASALEIRVKDRVTVRGDTVYLGDIATFHPKEDSLAARLAQVDVASSPSPGGEVRLNSRFLTYKIGSFIDNEKDVRLNVPDSLLVERTGQVIGTREMEEIFKSHVRQNSPWPSEKLVFDRISVPESITLPEGALRWEVWERGNGKYLGNVSLTVNFWVDEKQIRKVPLSGKVTVQQEVLRATRKIESGARISADDVSTASESHRNLRRDVLTSPEEAVGKRATRNILPGQYILPRMIEDPPLVRKGSRVVIKAEKALILMTTVGKVLEDGRAGDQVRVVNLRSGKELLATVTNSGMVEVQF